MQIKLTLASTYVPKWALWEGVREVVANARDAVKEYGGTDEIEYSGGRIKVTNRGCTLPLRALLLGASTKTERPADGTIGQWGEGLKLALLALVRAGHKVKIRNGAEVWTPRLAYDEQFGADVLVVDVRGGRDFVERVSVEIDGVSPEQWKEIRRGFLWLDGRVINHPEKAFLAGKPYGQILLHPSQAGRVYYLGVYVETIPEYTYGYNFTCKVEIDRDRKMLQSWDRQWKVAKLWESAAASAQPAMDKLMDLMAGSARETESLQHLAQYAECQPVVAEATARFQRAYGPNAVPVANLEEAKSLEHLGARGVVVGEVQRALLKSTIGDVAKVHEKLREQVTRRYSWDDLTGTQQKNLTEAIEMSCLAGLEIALADIDVVDFRDDRLLGQFKDGRVLLASRVVSVWRLCLMALIHEVAHRQGHDGEKGHVATIESAWATLVEELWR